MTEFRALTVVKHAPDVVFITVRDRMAALAEHLNDVESVTVTSRSDEAEGTTRLVNVWRSSASVPSLLKTVVRRDMLAWTDTATWTLDDRSCRWTIEPHFAPEASQCTGMTVYEPALGGRGTRIVMTGRFEVVAARLPGASVLIGGPSRRGIESFVTELVPRNFQKLGKAISAVLAAEQQQSAAAAGPVRPTEGQG